MTSRTDSSGTTQYIWDFENRLRQVIKPDGTSINYKYNALGQRTERYVGANSTKFTYDGDDVLLDVNSDGSFVKYVNGLGIDDKIRQTVNGQAQYFVQDHLGSTNALTDATGNVVSSATYDSFGNASGNLATRYGYTGREKDADTGLHYYRARWYDSNLGRFLSEDPIGLSGGINQFGYVSGNPQNSSDPSGLYPDTLFEEINRFSQSPEAVEFATLAASPEGRASMAAGGSAAVAYGGTSVAVAGAAPIAITVGGGLVIGGVIGLPIGNYTSSLPGNPFVNGSLNPFGKSAADVANEPWTPRKPKEDCDDDDDRPSLVLGMSPYEEEYLEELLDDNPDLKLTTYKRQYGQYWSQATFKTAVDASPKIYFTDKGMSSSHYGAFLEKVNRGIPLDKIGGNVTNKELYLLRKWGVPTINRR
jgi:RHS repeat-associated protein